MPSYPRESVEFQPVIVTVDGNLVTTGVEIAVTDRGDRPTTWVPAVVLEGKTGLMVSGYSPGDHFVWTRFADDPETPVILAGYFRTT